MHEARALESMGMLIMLMREISHNSMPIFAAQRGGQNPRCEHSAQSGSCKYVVHWPDLVSVCCCAPWARSLPDGIDADGCEVAQEFRWSFTSRVHALHGSLKCQDISFRMQMLSSVELACDRSDVLNIFPY